MPRGGLPALLIALLVGTAEMAPASPSEPSILLLLPGRPGLPAAASIASGIRTVLLTDWSFRVSIEMEHVDVARFASPETEERRLRTVYGLKYAGHRFDVIVAALPEPFGFVLRARDELWPGTPVVVCGVDERSVRKLKPPPGFAVLTIRFDMEGTVRAATALLPDTRHVALVGGASPPEQVYHDLIRQAVSAAGPLDVIDLTKLPIADALARVSSLPNHTVVVQSSYQVDGAGRRFYGIDLVPHFANAANRPVFTPLGLALGRGVVGGSIVEFEDIGRDAGMLASRLLRGEAPPVGPVPSSAKGVPRFDARQLARWRLDERRLPPGSEVLYRTPTLWEQYRWHLAAMLALIGAQTALIVALLVHRRQRREAQAQLAERLRLEALVSEVGAALTIVPAPQVGEEITECLRRVATFLGVDRIGLWRPAGGNVVSLTHTWQADSVAPSPDTVDLDRFPYLRDRVRLPDGSLSFRRLDELPPEAIEESPAFGVAGVRSFAAIPLRASGHWLGLLALLRLRGERAWPHDVMQQLRMLAEHFAGALIRVQNMDDLESSVALTAGVLAALPGEAAIIDSAGIIVQTNDAWANAARTGPAECRGALSVGANYLQTCANAIDVPPTIAPKLGQSIESILRGELEEFDVEYPRNGFGESRWFEIRVRRLGTVRRGAAVMRFDVTTRREAEIAVQRHVSELAHLDRVAGMGQLASSIAHELNQPLTAILANAQAAQRMVNAGSLDLPEMQACLEDIVADDRRAADVIHHMRSLLRKTDFERRPIALNDLVVNTMGLVANEALLQRVPLRFHPASILPVVCADLVQIQQVILNLLTNAVAAAAAGQPPRRVTLWTALIPPYVEVGVQDSGHGIAEADLPRIFDPFFTTKAEGLGVGLALSRTIVEAHGGRLTAENDRAGGAIFRLHLRTDSPASDRG